MKRAKVMLIAIAVLATVGGTLAFKASKFNLSRYCTTNVQGAACVNFTEAKTINSGTAAFTVYYTTTNTNSCASALACESTTSTSFTTIE